MERHQEDMLVRIVTDWNETVGNEVKLAIEGYRNNFYYTRRHDEQFNKDMTGLLLQIGEQIDKRPTQAKNIVERALKLLDQPLRAAS